MLGLPSGSPQIFRKTYPQIFRNHHLQHLMERGRRLRELRERSQLTQVQLAERSGFEQGQISNWEAGRRGMTATTAILLAGALNATTEQLLCATARREAAPEKDDLASGNVAAYLACGGGSSFGSVETATITAYELAVGASTADRSSTYEIRDERDVPVARFKGGREMSA
jgi:transcriptional regulator with XRE-family HTH domain